jgi:ABC-type sugar transport system permease subunit
VPARLLLALGLALLLHRRAALVGSARTAAVLPMVVPEIAYGLLWLWLLNPVYGPINQLLLVGGQNSLTAFGRIPRLSLFIYRNAFEYLRYGYAAAATLVILLLTVLAVLVQWRLIRPFWVRYRL